MAANTDAVQRVLRVPGRLVLRTLRRPRPIAQRRLRHGLPPTFAQRHTKTVSLWTSQPATATVPSVMPVPTPPAEALPPAPPADALVMRGRFWEVTYGGRTGIVDDSRGLRYIALLVGRAGRKSPIHAKELVALAAGQPAGVIELTSAVPLLDDTARRQLITRLEELASERREATSLHDSSRLAGLDEEYERIADALAEGAVEGRRSRRGTFGTDGEKARKAVSKAISEAISKIASHRDLSALAEHFTSAIHKGLWLSYAGDIDWEIDAKL